MRKNSIHTNSKKCSVHVQLNVRNIVGLITHGMTDEFFPSDSIRTFKENKWINDTYLGHAHYEPVEARKKT